MKNPAQIAQAACDSARDRCSAPLLQTLILGALGGGYVGLGGFCLTAVTAPSGANPLAGAVLFSVALILVILAGGQLFSGNCLLSIGAFCGSVSMKSILRNWFWVYLANFAGALLVAFLVLISGLWKSGGGAVAVRALTIAAGKMSLSFGEAFARGVLCNWLVVLAVWCAMASDQIVGKIWAIVVPITAFVASGYEHCVANMYFFSLALMLKSQPPAIQAAPETLSALSRDGLWSNLVPVTLGNLAGGTILVALAYYAAYRPKAGN